MKVTDKKRLENALTVLTLASQNVQRVLEDAKLTEEEKEHIPGTNFKKGDKVIIKNANEGQSKEGVLEGSYEILVFIKTEKGIIKRSPKNLVILK